ncbi:MAG: SigB/SigF/SigG family RNA polymerase sigma factor [Armatimonadota bacterium]
MAIIKSKESSLHGGDLPILPPAELERLSHEFARTRNPELRDKLILCHQRLVRSIAARFMGSGESLEDIVQVGNIGLIHAIDRFSAERGTRFSTFATPTILGEIRRYFRDKATGIRVPRRMVEIQQHARKVRQTLNQELGRNPTTAELARRLDVSEEALLIALEAGDAVRLVSLDSALEGSSGAEGATLLELVGARDRSLADLEDYGDLRAAMDLLPAREHEVIRLRFFDDVSQAKIAEQMGISQMHVSRLQHRALRRLRETMAQEQRFVERGVVLRPSV